MTLDWEPGLTSLGLRPGVLRSGVLRSGALRSGVLSSGMLRSRHTKPGDFGRKPEPKGLAA